LAEVYRRCGTAISVQDSAQSIYGKLERIPPELNREGIHKGLWM